MRSPKQFTDKEVTALYEFYRNETSRLFRIKARTKNRRIKTKLFDRAMRLRDKYDWTYDELDHRGLPIPRKEGKVV